MRKIKILKYIRAEVITAEPLQVITQLVAAGIEVLDMTQADMITVQLTVHNRQYKKLESFINQSGGRVKAIEGEGLLWRLEYMKRRPVLTAGLVLFMIVSLALSERILLINVSGNNTVPSSLIIQEAAACGIRIGCSRGTVRSEEIKNMLLSRIPQLQWVGVNIYGSTATIQVKERSDESEQIADQPGVFGIEATHDGVISRMIVYQGTPFCEVGMRVCKGELLVSGYTDCGLKVIGQKANAEIFAYTLRQNTFVFPNPTLRRGEIIKKGIGYKLRIGKKVINLYNHSGIPDTSCGKIYHERKLTLPGGIHLPISMIAEEWFQYETTVADAPESTDSDWMKRFAVKYLNGQMVAGKILDQNEVFEVFDSVVKLYTESNCEELIGQLGYEETLNDYAKDN